MDTPEPSPALEGARREEIVCVTRGEIVEVFRVRLLEGNGAALERFENGDFVRVRELSYASDRAETSLKAEDQPSDEPLERAIRRALAYLDGSVTVGERDLLSPTSALTRNLRWFPGDLQMLGTSFHYVRELFPSAQFHVTQLFRRVFGDVAFLGLILLSSACWLRTRSNARFATLAFVLELASLVAIIGFDRFWEPIRYRWKKIREVRSPDDGRTGALRFTSLVVSQVLQGLAAVTLNTLIGLTNLLINPVKIFQAYLKVRRGKTLEWKASSVSAGQDMRGWPVADFLHAYGGAAKVGLLMLVFLGWLVLLGAPLDLFGLNSVGVFMASFLTAWFYAWYSALPYSAETGVPQYELTSREFWGLTLLGVAGVGISLGLFAVGLYPMPALEPSTGYLALFLSGSCAFAAVFPSYYRIKRRLLLASAKSGAKRPRRRFSGVVVALATCSAIALALVPSPSLRDRAHRFFIKDPARFRVPTVERDVYTSVGVALKRTRTVEPEPLLSTDGTQVTLSQTPQGPVFDARELIGIPSPRPKRVALRDQRPLPELAALPLAARIPINKPRRDFVLATAKPREKVQPPHAAHLEAVLEARRRARDMAPRLLSPAELSEQTEFLKQADYPWIGREDLEKLGSADVKGARLPLVEMARVYHFDEIKSLWDQVPAAAEGNPAPRARFALLLDGIDGATSLGREPSAEHVQAFLAAEREVAARWPREFPNVPLGALRERVAGTPGGAFQVARHELLYGRSFDDVVRRLRLDYVNAAWNRPPLAPNLRRIFRDRVEVEQPESLELDWGDNEEARVRMQGLETEQLVASKILAPTFGAKLASIEELEATLKLVERSLDPANKGRGDALSAALSHTFRVEGLNDDGGSSDAPAELLRARLWAQTMSGRLGQMAARVAVNAPLPGDANDQALLAEVTSLRYPSPGGDDADRRALEWLVLVDASETYRELVDGYDRFRREFAERGFGAKGFSEPPQLSSDELWRDLFSVWRELPAKYPNIPARADLVGEFVAQTAYFSSPDGKRGRTPSEFIQDFSGVFADADRLMAEAPPPMIQELTDAVSLKTQGRLSRSLEARRFFAWWNVSALTRVVRYALGKNRGDDAVEPRSLASDWAELASSGATRWPHLPWRTPGFSEYFVTIQHVARFDLGALWHRFEAQLNRAEAISAHHVVPPPAFEALIEHRVSEKTGMPNFDPVSRRGNAILALSELAETAAKNGVRVDPAHPNKLGTMLVHLHDALSRSYPSLYWDADGIIESYLMLALVNGWDERQMLSQFDAEWSLANALARGGLLARLGEVIAKDPSKLSPADRSVRTFIDTQATRLEKKAGMAPQGVRARAMNALLALTSLALSAGEEGLIPVQQGSAWNKERVRRWAVSAHSADLDAATSSWALGLARDYGELVALMRTDAPHFAWEDGSFVETELLVARSSGVDVRVLEEARRDTWRTASELTERHVTVPDEFVRLVASDSRDELRQRIAAARSKDPSEISQAELSALEEPELLPQTALLVLADVLAHVHAAYGTQPDPAAIAMKIAEVRSEGPGRYASIPWSAKGFVSSLVVAAERPDFGGDVWRYAEFIDLPAVDRLLAEADAGAENPSPAGAWNGELPPEVLADMRAIMTKQTGRTPSSDRVVAFQALRDGLFLTKEFVPEVTPSLAASLALVRVRARVRALAERYPALHIVTSSDQSPRVGFADRLAAIATKQALRSGLTLQDPAFAERATQLLESKFLSDVDRIYALVRQSFPEEELDYYKESIARDARIDNERRAKQSGLSPESLSVPRVSDDDVVADFALYELLYAQEIGQKPSYVADLFDIYDKLRVRPDLRAEYHAGLSALDREGAVARAAFPDAASWQKSAEYAAWWEKRGDYVKQARGKLIALSRTFALVKQAAFSPESAPEARAAFARFGSFDTYLSRFFDDVMLVRRTPEFKQALTELARRDSFLSDGVEFAIAEFKLHVLDRLFGGAESLKVTRRIAQFLPKVNEDYRLALGLVPGLETGVPFYDAFSSYERADLQAAAGTDVLRRANMVQRGLQSWTRTYVLKQAYKVLFDRDLDEEDPTKLPSSSLFRRRTVGDEVKELLETRLPERLSRETGSRDLVVWVEWLMKNGEIGLDGQPLGTNAYADAVAGYERRLSDYTARIEAGEARGKNVRAERQRVLDIQREYGSLRARVEALRDAARESSSRYAQASRDYYEALWQSAFWLLAVIVSWGLAALAASRLPSTRRFARRWLPIAFAAIPLALVAVPFWALANPDHAARIAGRPLAAVRLLEQSESERPAVRGVAAQLEKTRPWTIFTAVANDWRNKRSW